MTQTASLHITRGEYWQRVIAPRDRRTHWPSPSTSATAFYADNTGASVSIPTTILNDGSILLLLTETETAAIAEGQYYFQVTSDPFIPQYNMGGLVYTTPRVQIVVRGTLTVTSVDYSSFLDTTDAPPISPTLPEIIGGGPA